MSEIEKHFGINALNGAFASKPDDNRSIWFILGFLVFSGAEGVRVVLRENFGRKGINLRKLWICSLSFMILGLLILSDGKNIGAGLALNGISIYILITGYVKRNHGRDNSYYQGHLFGKNVPYSPEEFFWTKNSVFGKVFGQPKVKISAENQLRIVNIYFEPILVIFFGIIIFFTEPLVGVPIIFCGLSVWFEIICNIISPQTASEKAQVKVNKINDLTDPTLENNEVQID